MYFNNLIIIIYYMDIKQAIINNIKYQKQNRKNKYTKPIYFKLIEEYISTKGLVCYGGTAINMYLPNEHKFYNEDDIPDYDCYSNNAINDAIELANILKNNNIGNIEVKSAMFKGTYKVFINFIPIVDFTNIKNEIFLNIYNKSVKINNILYAPPSYLKISMYQELSRPMGDISRWEKVYNRLELLNKYQPLYIINCSITHMDNPETDEYKNINNDLIELIKKNKWVVFGDYGLSYYIKYFPKKYQKMERTINIPYILTENVDDVLDKLPFKYSLVKYSYQIVNNFYQILYNNYPVLYIFITNT